MAAKLIFRWLALLRRDSRSNRNHLLSLRPKQVALSLETRSQTVVFDRSDWVSVWLDPVQTIVSENGLMQATRAITLDGRLIWLVRHEAYQRAYHSRAEGAASAVHDAESAWRRRKEQVAAKRSVRQMAKRLATFRDSYPVFIDDAYNSPLCDEGVDGFLRTLGISGFRRYPGWLIGWLYFVDRQVGFVIYEAHKREHGADVAESIRQ